MAKLKGLGRGMDAVFEDNSIQGGGATMLRISDVEPRKNQPRRIFDEAALAELAASIAQHGIIQPLVVRDDHTGFYSIIAGERRWRAAKMAGLTEVPVVILDVDDAKAAELALIENLQREDLNPVEEAQAYRALMDDYGLTQQEVADRVGKQRPTVANTLRLLDLTDGALEMLADGRLSAGHARALLGVRDRNAIDGAAKDVVSRGLSVRDTEKLVRKLNAPKKEEPDEPDETVVRVDYKRDLELRMTRSLGRPVRIKDGGKIKKLELEYTDNDDLQDLIERICGDLED